MFNLALLSYGNEIELKRAIVAVFSFFSFTSSLHLQGKVRVIIYTDNPKYFKDYFQEMNVEYNLLTLEKSVEMLGGTDYLFRRKIALIDEIFRIFPGEHILFIDSDTFFIRDPTAMLKDIESGASFMHEKEYSFYGAIDIYKRYMAHLGDNPEKYPLSFLNLIGNTTFEIQNKAIKFNERQYCWNSGVLGLNMNFAPLFSDIFNLNDRIYENTRWFIAEQLAFSLVLQSTSELREAKSFVNHYWRSKKRIAIRTEEFVTPAFAALSFVDKVKLTRRFATSINRLILHENWLYIAMNGFRNRNYIKFLRATLKAAYYLPTGNELYKYLKYHMDKLT